MYYDTKNATVDYIIKSTTNANNETWVCRYYVKPYTTGGTTTYYVSYPYSTDNTTTRTICYIFPDKEEKEITEAEIIELLKDDE